MSRNELETQDREQDRESDQEMNQETEDLAYSKAGKMKRILAIIALVIMAALLIWLIVCIITNSELTIPVLFCNIIYPIILYVMVWLKRVFSRK